MSAAVYEMEMPVETPKLEPTAAEKRASMIETALAKLADDAGALFERDVLKAICDARQGSAAEYQRIRAKAKAAKASVSELDRLTQAEQSAGADDTFPPVEAWSQPVDGAALVRDLQTTLHRFVVADPPTMVAAALWAVHTWCMDVLTVSPLAHIAAPEKRCGKTLLLTALSRLVFRPLATSNISPSALFRSMEAWQPTLLIDEADSFLRENEEARGLINSGLYRETAFVMRTVGDDFTPTKFSTWGAKVVCGIGKLADTIEDRSIPLRMRRKVSGERVENIRHSDAALWEALQSRIARWTADNLHRIGATRPDRVLGLHDRANDCWEPLLAIAEAAGGQWPERARHAAIALHGIEEETPSIGIELLSAIKEAFERKHATRIASHDLLELLVADEEGPWATWNRGKPMAVRQLAARVKDFGISPGPVRPGDGVARGYKLEAFADAFRRYLSADREQISVTTLQANNGAGSSGFSSVTPCQHVTDVKPLKPSNGAGCNDVTDKNPLPGKEGAEGETEVFDL